MTQQKALVVLSGGQDSTTCLFWALQHYGRESVSAITFDYHQRHYREIQSAQRVRMIAGIPQERHEVVRVGPLLVSTSPLTDATQQLEQYESHEEMEKIIGSRVEKTFVPMRNAFFLTLAANRAAAQGITDIVTGVCEADNANYPDCRQEYIDSQIHTINKALGTTDMTIMTPLMYMTKAESVKLALNIPGAYTALAYSHTAYDGSYPPSGKDHATVLRAHGFAEANIPDPLIIRAHREFQMVLPNSANYERRPWVLAHEHIRSEIDNGFRPLFESFDWWNV